MRTRKSRIDAQCAPGTLQCLVELQPVVVDDRLVMQTQRIGRSQRGGAARSGQRVVKPADRAIHLADVAMIKRRIGPVGKRAFHQR